MSFPLLIINTSLNHIIIQSSQQPLRTSTLFCIEWFIYSLFLSPKRRIRAITQRKHKSSISALSKAVGFMKGYLRILLIIGRFELRKVRDVSECFAIALFMCCWAKERP